MVLPISEKNEEFFFVSRMDARAPRTSDSYLG